uniref:Uncharacterized protein n=1 Tax=Parascaris univalens TaxID=6257 RepID=A0A914ZS31_PARUN
MIAQLDFWRVGKRVVIGTEAPCWVGYGFYVLTLDSFKLFHVVEESGIFSSSQSAIVPISMAIHKRSGPDKRLWGSSSAIDFIERHLYQEAET